MYVDLLNQVSDARVARGLKAIPENCFRFHTLKHSVATIIANRVQNIFTLKNHLGMRQSPPQCHMRIPTLGRLPLKYSWPYPMRSSDSE
jgi:hypothetical protein